MNSNGLDIWMDLNGWMDSQRHWCQHQDWCPLSTWHQRRPSASMSVSLISGQWNNYSSLMLTIENSHWKSSNGCTTGVRPAKRPNSWTSEQANGRTVELLNGQRAEGLLAERPFGRSDAQLNSRWVIQLFDRTVHGWNWFPVPPLLDSHHYGPAVDFESVQISAPHLLENLAIDTIALLFHLFGQERSIGT